MIDLKDIQKKFDLLEAYQLIDIYEVYLDEKAPKIKIKIVVDQEGKYWGIPNHSIKGKECMGFYLPLHPKNTPEEALKDAISSIKMFYKGTDDDEWKINENF